jgi:hypothetical protein
MPGGDEVTRSVLSARDGVEVTPQVTIGSGNSHRLGALAR